jgi:hypothetical protein
MTTLSHLFGFVGGHPNTAICGLSLSSQRPAPNPPQPKNFVLCSMCSQDPSAAVTFVANPGSFTITFPKVMMYSEGFTWPPSGPGPDGAPGEGQYFSVAITQYRLVLGLKNIRYSYGVEIEFPWSESFSGWLTEDPSGVVYGSDGSAMITMTIGNPS